jgi:hypothetical protein
VQSLLLEATRGDEKGDFAPARSPSKADEEAVENNNSVVDLDSFRKAGFLRRKHRLLNTWTRVYAALLDQKLAFFKSEVELRSQTTHELRRHSSVRLGELTANGAEFTLVLGAKELVLAAANEVERAAWVQQLEEAVHELSSDSRQERLNHSFYLITNWERLLSCTEGSVKYYTLSGVEASVPTLNLRFAADPPGSADKKSDKKKEPKILQLAVVPVLANQQLGVGERRELDIIMRLSKKEMKQGALRVKDQITRCMQLLDLRRTIVSWDAHETKLQHLWAVWRPAQPWPGRSCAKAWGDLGFQGKDPCTDFRAMGLLAVEVLLFLGEKHPLLIQRLLTPTREYPVACAVINLVSHLANLLTIHKDVPVRPFTNHALFRKFAASEDLRSDWFFAELCAVLLAALDDIYLDRNLKYMDFPHVLMTVTDLLDTALSHDPIHFAALCAIVVRTTETDFLSAEFKAGCYCLALVAGACQPHPVASVSSSADLCELAPPSS